MNFLKALFGSKEASEEDKKKADEARDFEVLKYDGVRAMHSNQMEYAIKCFTHALGMQDDPEITDYLSQAYIRTGELPQAYEQLRKLSEARPDNHLIYVRMAHVAYMMEDYQAMTEACVKALQIDENNAEVMYLYARAHIGLGDTSSAVAMLTKAIEQNDAYGDAYLLRGETLLAAGDVDGADRDAAYLLEHVPDNEDVLMLKARIEQTKGNTSEAIGLYSRVIEVNPFNADAYRGRGQLRQETGDAGSGAEDIRQADELQAQMRGEEKEEGIEKDVKQIYKNIDPYGIFG